MGRCYGNTIFHKIIRKEIPANIVHEHDKWVAFRDVNPVAPTHILIVPRKDIAGVGEAKVADEQLLIARELGLTAIFHCNSLQIFKISV